MESRRSRKLTEQIKKRLLINVVGIIVIIFLIFKFGIPLLTGFALFISSSKNSKPAVSQKITTFLLAPMLISSFSATNSASIDIAGTAVSKTTIKLFVDNSYSDSIQSKDDGSFVFKNVSLHDGQNTFTAKVKNEKTQSDFSLPMVIIYQAKAPSVTIDFPSDGQTFSKDDIRILVRGKTDNADIKITVNDFWAITDDKGAYSYNLSLKNGDNQIKVDAVDQAGNKTEKTIKVISNQ